MKKPVSPPSQRLTALFVLSVICGIIFGLATFNALFSGTEPPHYICRNIFDELELYLDNMLSSFISGTLYLTGLTVCAAYQLFYVIRLAVFYSSRRKSENKEVLL